MVVSIGVPRPVDLKRTGGLATLGVAQIGRDYTKLALELVEWVERVRSERCDRRVEPAARDHQQREAGAGLFVINANLASLIERHAFSPFGKFMSSSRVRGDWANRLCAWSGPAFAATTG
jgi:hypothetical protein